MTSESVEPPVTRLRADARRNRERVLTAAEEVFGEQGLAVPIDEIARRAGVGAGTVYRHFPTKQALFHAVIELRTEHLVDDGRELAEAADPGAAFFTFVTRKVEQAALNKALVDALEAEGSGFSADHAAATEFWRLLGSLLERGQQAGAVRPDLDLDQLRAIMIGCITARRQVPDPAKARATLGIVCDGMRATRLAAEPDRR